MRKCHVFFLFFSLRLTLRFCFLLAPDEKKNSKKKKQARIASSRGGASSGGGAAAAASAAAATAASQQKQQKQGTFQKQPQGFDSAEAPSTSLSSPFSSSPTSAAVADARRTISPQNANLSGGGGSFSSSPSFLDGGVAGGAGKTGRGAVVRDVRSGGGVFGHEQDNASSLVEREAERERREAERRGREAREQEARREAALEAERRRKQEEKEEQAR